MTLELTEKPSAVIADKKVKLIRARVLHFDETFHNFNLPVKIIEPFTKNVKLISISQNECAWSLNFANS